MQECSSRVAAGTSQVLYHGIEHTMEHRTALGFFLALAVNRPVVALNGRVLVSSSGRRAAAVGGAGTRSSVRSVHSNRAAHVASVDLVDVDANLLHPDLANDIEHHIQVVWRRQRTIADGQLSESHVAFPSVESMFVSGF